MEGVWISPQKMAKSQKTEKVNKKRKNWKFEKKNMKTIPRYGIEENVYQIWCRLEYI